MKEEQGEKAFLDEVKRRLDKGADEIDELTMARLSAARRRAVEAGSRPHADWSLGEVLVGTRGWRITWLAAALFLLAALAILRLQTTAPTAPALPLLDDMELLGAAEELEFYRELDFFIWVADEQGEG